MIHSFIHSFIYSFIHSSLFDGFILLFFFELNTQDIMPLCVPFYTVSFRDMPPPSSYRLNKRVRRDICQNKARFPGLYRP